MLCYSIPKVILIDDDPSILSTLEYSIKNNLQNNVIVECFDNSKIFKDHFTKKISNTIHISDLYLAYLNNSLCENSLFTELDYFLPLVIIDQNLENDKKGTDICEFIKDHNENIFICLLTGEVDFEIAVELHNKRLIDFFLKKENENVSSIIINNLLERIEKRKLLFKFDGEIPLHKSFDIYDQDIYSKNLAILLNPMHYHSYFILNLKGDVVIMMDNNETKLYKYDPGKESFSLCSK